VYFVSASERFITPEKPLGSVSCAAATGELVSIPIVDVVSVPADEATPATAALVTTSVTIMNTAILPRGVDRESLVFDIVGKKPVSLFVIVRELRESSGKSF
jgi:hypothetical protein